MRADPDKQMVYYAESLTFDGTIFTAPLHTNEITELAYRLFTHPWWVENSIAVPMIKPTTNGDTASYARIYHPHPFFGVEHDPVIHISPLQIDVHTLAHEAAHVAQYHFFPLAMNPNFQAHGSEFQAIYLRVVNILLGYAAAEALAENLTKFIPTHSWRQYLSDLDVDSVGIYQQWYLLRSLNKFKTVLDSAKRFESPLRINDAIAL